MPTFGVFCASLFSVTLLGMAMQQANHDMEVVQFTRDLATSLDAILSVLRDCERT
jgi:hypothetical protein